MSEPFPRVVVLQAALGAVIVADRAGKGLRTAPRDALITLSAPEPLLGRAFGIHRAMDSMGAFAGPLAALGVLTAVGAATPAAFDALFLTSFCVAVAGLLVLAAFARDRRDRRPAASAVTLRAAGGLLRAAGVRRLLYAAGLLGLATIGDGFVYLLLCSALPAALVTVAALCCYGAFYAATDGVLMALAGPLLPADLRTTGLACVQTVQALAYLGSSLAFGLAWTSWGSAAATGAAAVAAAVAATATAALLTGRRTTVEDAP
ncbi:hypothetical protein [Nonomuraea sp. NPDC049607]|uniref:hypothetical protein n=1 Tax=unclassified Nonomuraea TaxID=2593643 RepID=UPI00342045EB